MTRYAELLCLLALMIPNTLATPVNQKRVPLAGTLNFPCTGHRYGDMTEVCKTMCYGINCMEFPSAMYYDKQTAGDSPKALEVAEERRREAGCQIGNRCTKSPYEKKGAWECDEFPFKTTDRDRMMHRDTLPINRCVPRMQNKWKMDLLQDFYKSQGDYASTGGLHGEEGWFKLVFQNYAGIDYCADTSKKCVNDGNMGNSGGLAQPPGPPTIDPPHRYYLTKRGFNLYIPAGAEIGDVVSSHGEDGNLVVDEIVALANATSIVE